MRNIKAELEHSIKELEYIKLAEQVERKRRAQLQKEYDAQAAMNSTGGRYQTRYDIQPALNMNTAASQYDSWYYAQQAMTTQRKHEAEKSSYEAKLREYSEQLMGRTVTLSKEIADLIPSESQMEKFPALREAWDGYQLVRRMCLGGSK